MIEIIVIEHMEPVLSKWMWIEYKHTSEMVGKDRLWITNVKDPDERALLRKIAKNVYEESVSELNISYDIIVLDPSASRTLEPEDLRDEVCVVIGGIMGDYPPKGRTRELSSKLKRKKTRNRGPLQFPIDSAAYIALEIDRGKRLDDIPILDQLEIEVSEGHTIVLPYAYPLVNGRPLISEEEIKYLKSGIEEDEARAIKEGKVRSVAEDLR